MFRLGPLPAKKMKNSLKNLCEILHKNSIPDKLF